MVCGVQVAIPIQKPGDLQDEVTDYRLQFSFDGEQQSARRLPNGCSTSCVPLHVIQDSIPMITYLEALRLLVTPATDKWQLQQLGPNRITQQHTALMLVLAQPLRQVVAAAVVHSKQTWPSCCLCCR